MKHFHKKHLLLLLVGMGVLLWQPRVWGFRDSLLALADPYYKVLAKYTRNAKKYTIANLDTEYLWTATYLSPTFLSAVDQRLRKYYPEGMSPYAAKIRAVLNAPEQTELFVAVFANDRQMKKLLGRKNLWEIKLIADGKIMDPLEVKEVDLTPMHYRIFPYLNKWHKGFRIVFPFNAQASSGGDFYLLISGPLGSQSAHFTRS